MRIGLGDIEEAPWQSTDTFVFGDIAENVGGFR